MKPRPVTTDEVAAWFIEAMRSSPKRPQIHTPAVSSCERFAKRLNGLAEMYWGRPLEDGKGPKKTDLVKAFEVLLEELNKEQARAKQFEAEVYANGDAPQQTYSYVLADISEKISWCFAAVDYGESAGYDNELKSLLVELAGWVLGVWNRTTGRQSKTIGRSTPCERVLVKAVARVTGTEFGADTLRSELARARAKNLLHVWEQIARED